MSLPSRDLIRQKGFVELARRVHPHLQSLSTQETDYLRPSPASTLRPIAIDCYCPCSLRFLLDIETSRSGPALQFSPQHEAC